MHCFSPILIGLSVICDWLELFLWFWFYDTRLKNAQWVGSSCPFISLAINLFQRQQAWLQVLLLFFSHGGEKKTPDHKLKRTLKNKRLGYQAQGVLFHSLLRKLDKTIDSREFRHGLNLIGFKKCGKGGSNIWTLVTRLSHLFVSWHAQFYRKFDVFGLKLGSVKWRSFPDL